MSLWTTELSQDDEAFHGITAMPSPAELEKAILNLAEKETSNALDVSPEEAPANIFD